MAPVHVRVAARLEDQEPPKVVEVLADVAPPLEDSGAFQRGHARGDDAERLAARVVVDRLDPHGSVAGEARMGRAEEDRDAAPPEVVGDDQMDGVSIRRVERRQCLRHDRLPSVRCR